MNLILVDLIKKKIYKYMKMNKNNIYNKNIKEKSSNQIILKMINKKKLKKNY